MISINDEIREANQPIKTSTVWRPKDPSEWPSHTFPFYAVILSQSEFLVNYHFIYGDSPDQTVESGKIVCMTNLKSRFLERYKPASTL